MSFKFPRTIAFFITAFIVIASTAHAAAIPVLSVQMTSTGGNWAANPTGTPVGGDVYNYTGSHDHGTWLMTWNLDVDADPFINGNIVITNNTAFTQTFTPIFTLPVVPIAPNSFIG